MKKILIRTAIVVVSVFALYVIVEASNNTTSESKKAKTELAEELAGTAATASCCDTAPKHPGCDPAACDHTNCDPAKCDPATCNNPGCDHGSTAGSSCCSEKSSTASAQATSHQGCASKCGGH